MVWHSRCKTWEELDGPAQHGVMCLWEWGELDYKLDVLQLVTYNKMLSFFDRCKSSFERLWVNEWSRRLGKDFLTWVYVRSQMRKNRNHIYHYGTAFEVDLNLILIPLINLIESDCPPEYRLIARQTKGMFVDPVTNSEVRLIGLDKNPDGIRGNRGDGIVVTEYSYCKNIDISETAFLPMLVENENAWRIYNSTPGEFVLHKWHTSVVPKARLSGGYSKHILDECPRFSRSQIEAAYDEFGGRSSTKSRRELMCEHVGEETSMVIPEWNTSKQECIVDDYIMPHYTHCYVGMDPGMVDLTGIVWAYYDFEKDMLVFTKAWAAGGKNTDEIAVILKQYEEKWKLVKYYDSNGKIHNNPHKRVCDRELRLIGDLESIYDLSFVPTAKHDLMTAINSFRVRVGRNKIRILPEAFPLAIHMESAIWDKRHKAIENVGGELGHFDLLMAAVYLHRNVDTSSNPFPKTYNISESYYTPKPKGKRSGWTYSKTKRGGMVT